MKKRQKKRRADQRKLLTSAQKQEALLANKCAQLEETIEQVAVTVHQAIRLLSQHILGNEAVKALDMSLAKAGANEAILLHQLRYITRLLEEGKYVEALRKAKHVTISAGGSVLDSLLK